MASGTRAPSTIVTVSLNGQTDFNIPFEYLARKFVVVTLLGIDRKVLTLNSDYRFVSKTVITLANPTPAGYTQLELRRVTSATERLVDFHDGSILRAYDLNLSQIQTLHVAEEARDLASDILGLNDDGDLDARGKRIVNLGDASSANGAASYGQLLELVSGVGAGDVASFQALKRSYAEAGWRLVAGSFELGGELQYSTDVLLQSSSGKAFAGPIGVIPAGYDPLSDSRFTDVSGSLLKHSIDEILKVGRVNETTVVGKDALPNVDNVRYSVAVGYRALASQQSGTSNTAIGVRALENTDGESSANNVAVGRYALQSNTTGFDNVAVGSSSLINNTSGKANTAVGRNSMVDTLTGRDNVAVGEGCMPRLKAAASNVAVGVNACQYTDEGGEGTAGLNTGVGAGSMRFNRLGKNNVAIGAAAMEGYKQGTLAVFTATVSGGGVTSVTVVKEGSGYTSTPNVNAAGGGGTGVRLTPTMVDDGTGNSTFKIASITITSSGSGYTTPPTVATSGGGIGDAGRLEGAPYNHSNNIAVGNRALDGILEGSENVALGRNAGKTIKNGSSNVIVGNDALTATDSTGVVAIGRNAGSKLTAAANSVIIGTNSVTTSTGSLSGVTSVGSEALRNVSAANNTAVGGFAGRSITTGTSNTVVGQGAMGSSSASTGNNNTVVGANSKTAGGVGYNNTVVGASALNTLSDGSDAGSVYNCSTLGFSATVSGSNQVQLGNSTSTTYVYGTVQNRSDARDKADVRDTVLGIEFILGLRPVDGCWDLREDYLEQYTEQVGTCWETGEPITETRTRALPKDGSHKRARMHHWFIAQEVKELCDSLGVDFGGYQDHTIKDGADVCSLGYDEFIPPAVRAIQQCWERLDSLERRVRALE